MFEEKQDNTFVTTGAQLVAEDVRQAKSTEEAAVKPVRRRPSRRDAWFSTGVDISKARKPAAQR